MIKRYKGFCPNHGGLYESSIVNNSCGICGVYPVTGLGVNKVLDILYNDRITGSSLEEALKKYIGEK